jgi:hypothetical protein
MDIASMSDLERMLHYEGSSAKAQQSMRGRIDGVVVGRFLALEADAWALVAYPGQPDARAMPARSTISLTAEDLGAEVVLGFENGDPSLPIILGMMAQPSLRTRTGRVTHVGVEADGERLSVAAKEQLTLSCGEASITLTASGKVLIQGKYISSVSKGLQRITGAAVHIN